MRTFIVGPSAAGKTELAKYLDHQGDRYFNFDDSWNYGAPDPTAWWSKLPDKVIVDGFPYYPSAKAPDVSGLHQDDRVIILAVEYDKWRLRAEVKQPGGDHRAAYLDIYLRYVPLLYAGATQRGALVSLFGDDLLHGPVTRCMAGVIVRYPDMVRERLAVAPSSYDAMYQGVPEHGCRGYSEPSLTWDTIQRIPIPASETVYDLGCNHGYFTRAMGRSHEVVGVDQHADALLTARAIACWMGAQVDYRLSRLEDFQVPAGSTALLLNVLHHLPKSEAFLDTLRAAVVLFEGPREQQPWFEARWETVTEYPSHRKGRVILRARGRRA